MPVDHGGFLTDSESDRILNSHRRAVGLERFRDDFPGRDRCASSRLESYGLGIDTILALMELSSTAPRDRLIAAGAELCMKRSYEDVTEAEIALRAAVPASAMQECFPGGKEECLEAAEQAILLEVVAAVGRSYSADRSEWENVIYGVKTILELMAANPSFAYVGYIFSRQMAPTAVKKVNDAGHRTLEAMLERGWDYAPVPRGPASAALGVLGGAQALVRRELAWGQADRLPELLPHCVYIATVAFLRQSEAIRLMQQAHRLAAAEGTKMG